MRRRLAVAMLAGLMGVALPMPSQAATRAIQSGDFYFLDSVTGSTTEIRVPVGDQLVVDVVEGRRHTVDVDELGISSGAMNAGQTYTSPPLQQAGTFVMYCDTHLNRGHRITLVVGDGNPQPTASPSPSPSPRPSPSPSPSPPPTSAPTSSPAPAAPTATAPSPSSVDPQVSASGSVGASPPSPGAGTETGTPGPTPTDTAAPQDGPSHTPSEAPVGITGAPATPWTRGVRLALVAAVPMAWMAVWVLRRSGAGAGPN